MEEHNMVPMTLKNKRTISYENNSHNQMLLKLINQFILRWLNSCNKTIPFNMDVADGKWHFIALSWELTGRTRIFIDGNKTVDDMSVGTFQ
jgi:hypothetical protein